MVLTALLGVCCTLSRSAQAQSVEFVSVNDTGSIDALLGQSAVYAAPLRGGASQTRFAVASVTARRLSPVTHLWTLDASAPAVTTTNFAALPNLDAVGLEAMGPAVMAPLLMVSRVNALRFDVRFVMGGGGLTPTVSATPEATGDPELACDRSGMYCTLLFARSSILTQDRFATAVGMSDIVAQVQPATYSQLDRWDIAYDTIGGVTVSEAPGAPPAARALSLPPALQASEAPSARISGGQTSATNPKIACNEGFGHNNCAMVFNQENILRVRVLETGHQPITALIHDGQARTAMLHPLGYDVTAGPLGYRVAYFATLGLTPTLLAADVSIDGSYVSMPHDVPVDIHGPVRGLRATAALNREYTLITWIEGDGLAAVNRAFVLRPSATSVDVVLQDATEADQQRIPLDEAGVPPTDATSPPSDSGATMDAAMTADSTPPSVGRGHVFSGGACYCRAVPHTGTTRPLQWAAILLTFAATTQRVRRRQRAC